MKKRGQGIPPAFLVLSGVLLVYLLLPVAGLLPRLYVVPSGDWFQPEVLAAVAVSVETATTAVLLLGGCPARC